MALAFMPAFDEFPFEANLVGRLLIAYGELEFDLTGVLEEVLKDRAAATRAVFRLRGEADKANVVDAIVRPSLTVANLENDWKATLDAFNHRRKIRNQYAHSHWVSSNGKLGFTSLNEVANTISGPLKFSFRMINVELLEEQHEFFFFTMLHLTWIRKELANRRDKLVGTDNPRPERKSLVNLHMPKA